MRVALPLEKIEQLIERGAAEEPPAAVRETA